MKVKKLTKKEIKQKKDDKLERGERLIRMREKFYKKNRTETAKDLHIARPTLVSYETGKSDVPLTILIRMSDTYKVPINIMLGHMKSFDYFGTILKAMTPNEWIEFISDPEVERILKETHEQLSKVLKILPDLKALKGKL